MTKVLYILSASLLISRIAFADQFYGPFDYTNPQHYREKLPIVEQYHFNSDVENLTGTMPGGTVGAHLWYVINHFPNHHRALHSMARLWRRYLKKGQFPPGVPHSHNPNFLFERAIKFAPRDATVRMLYGMHLQKTGERDKALTQYKEAESLSPESAEIQYNIGLLYFKLGKYDQSKQHALKAYALGFPLPGLKNMLIEAGHWK